MKREVLVPFLSVVIYGLLVASSLLKCFCECVCLKKCHCRVNFVMILVSIRIHTKCLTLKTFQESVGVLKDVCFEMFLRKILRAFYLLKRKYLFFSSSR